MARLFVFFMLLFSAAIYAAPGDGIVNRPENNILFGDEEPEEKERQTHFECYDLTSDVSRIICLDDDIQTLHFLVEGTFEKKVALLPSNQKFSYQKEYNLWLHRRGSICRDNSECYREAYKKQLIAINDWPVVSSTQLELGQDIPAITLEMLGRKTSEGFYIDRLRYRHTGKTYTLYLYPFLNESSWELFMPKARVRQLDVNFDGIFDIVLFLGAQGAGEKKVAYLEYVPKENTFVNNPVLNRLAISSFDHEHKFVLTNWRLEDGRFGTDYYGYNHIGKLVRRYRQSHVLFTEEIGEQRVRRSIYRARGSRTVKILTETILLEEVENLSPALIEDYNTLEATAQNKNK